MAKATSDPNRNISGSFSSCGAPPETVMTEAIVTAVSAAAVCVAANVTIQSRRCGGPSSVAKPCTIDREITAINRKFVRLKPFLINGCRAPNASAIPAPTPTASRYSLTGRKNMPTTAGNSLSEKA